MTVVLFICACMYAGLLSINDSKEIINLAWDYRANWKFIGRELGIDAGTLDAIERDRRDVSGDCLPNVINEWLRNNPRPTRGAILAVLHSGHVSETTGSCLISVLASLVLLLSDVHV